MLKKIAIIGCGRIGVRHAEQICRFATLSAVCDIIPAKADELGNAYHAKIYYSLDDLLHNEKDTDVISVCTPNGLHATHCIQSLAAKKNVLCEKPLCINVADGKKMIEAALANNKKLFVVKQNRYNPPVVFVKELLNTNALGKIFSFQLNCFWNRPAEYYNNWKGTKDLDGGTLFTQFSHFIDLLYWYFGDASAVQSIKKNYQHPNIAFEDSGIVLFEMQSGITGAMNYSVNSYQQNMEGSLTILAEKGSLKIGGQYLNELEYFNVENIPVPKLEKSNSANVYGFYQGSMSNHDKVYQNLLLALDNDAHQFASAEEGLKTVEMIEKIYKQQ
jgi:UDP-N-acetyl-2-amino-2-deoxyglucuronate dehydrogenase